MTCLSRHLGGAREPAPQTALVCNPVPCLGQRFAGNPDSAGHETEDESEDNLAPCPTSSHVCLAAAIEFGTDLISGAHGAGDAEFAPSGSEAEDESEEEGSSDQESLASEGGSDEEAPGSEDEDEESGMDWDELEKEAERYESNL